MAGGTKDDVKGAAKRPKEFTPGYPLGARLSFAMQHACKNGAMLRQELEDNYGVTLTRSNLSKLLRGQIEYTRHVMEIAEVLGVNPRWLNSGAETMTDVTGRLSSRDRALSDVKRLARTHIFPPNRPDLIRFHGSLITAAKNHQISRDDLKLLDSMLTRIVKDNQARRVPREYHDWPSDNVPSSNE